MKLEIPTFEGEDPLGWIFQAQKFFNFHGVPDDQRLIITSFAFKGRALKWYEWMEQNQQISTWTAFLTSLKARFGPSDYEDVQGNLSKLVQKGTVADYQDEFESLSTRTVGLSDKFLLSCFISGLKPYLKREVQISRPDNM